MWPDRVSNPGPLTYELGALPIALRGPASLMEKPLQKAVHSNRKDFDPRQANWGQMQEFSPLNVSIFLTKLLYQGENSVHFTIECKESNITGHDLIESS